MKDNESDGPFAQLPGPLSFLVTGSQNGCLWTRSLRTIINKPHRRPGNPQISKTLIQLACYRISRKVK